MFAIELTYLKVTGVPKVKKHLLVYKQYAAIETGNRIVVLEYAKHLDETRQNANSSSGALTGELPRSSSLALPQVN